MKSVIVIVEHAGGNLSAYIDGAPIVVVGKDLKEIEKNMQEAIAFYLDYCKDENKQPVEILQGEISLIYRLDAATFINYYSGIFTKAALCRITGINERQLWHYAAGIHKPRRKQLERIQSGIRKLSAELTSISLL